MKRQITLTLIAALAVVGALSVPLTQTAQAESLVPEWIKQNAGWWADGTLDDETFLNGIKFLLENGVIDVSSKSNTAITETLTIGFIPVEKADELTPKAQALEIFLENELGADVEIVVPTNYETIIEGMRFGHIDVAIYGHWPCMDYPSKNWCRSCIGRTCCR